MSTKTIKQRIALVAAVAMVSGFISAVPASAAVTANSLVAATVIGNGNQNAAPAVGATNATAIAGVLNIASNLSTDGTTSTTTKSIGLINVGDSSTTKIAGVTSTAVMLSTGTLTFYTAAAARNTQMITVEGGSISATLNSTAISQDLTKAASNNTALAVSVKPSSGVSSMVVRMYVTDGYSTGSTSWTSAEMIAGDTTGLLTAQYRVTVASASTSGVLNASKSANWFVGTYNAAATTSDASGYTGSADNDGVVFVQTRIRDAYSNPITGAGLLSVSATGGLLVNLNPTGATDTGSATTDFEATSTPDADIVAVSAPSAAPAQGVVTISWNGTVIGSRTVGFSGEVAKITLSKPVIGQLGGTGSTNNVFTYAAYDAAGNQVYVDYGGTDNGNTPPSGFSGNSALYNTIVSAVTHKTDSSVDLSTGVVTAGKFYFTCGASAGTTPVGVTYTNISGTVVTSNSLSVSCAGKAASYKASYDKASYTPGEVATLTVQFYDSKGNKANDVQDVDTDTTGEITASTSGVTAIKGPGTTGADGADLDQGSLSFTYAVGTTEGTFTNKISVPDINTYAGTLNIITTDAIATLKIASGSTAVTNADVLKSIVALIASINKQIQALQKLILKR
jgi:hypothetical protein